MLGTVIREDKMKTKKNRKPANHSGSTFDKFLEEEGIKEEVEAVAIKRVILNATEAKLKGA